MALTNMKLSAEEAKDMGCCVGEGDSGPAYPYGLCIYLNNETLKKLGITELPDVGTKLNLAAVVEVTSNAQRQTQDGKTVDMDMQITDMALSAPVEKTAEQKLYSNSPMLS